MTGRIFDIQRFSIHDGPGIRTTVFLKGCPLRCKWCHNPESVSPDPILAYLPDKCVSCGECVSACPQGAIGRNRVGKAVLDRDRCKLCTACSDACAPRVFEIVGRDASVDEIMAVVLRDRDYYAESRGGMTVSGGEPLFQPAFTEALLRAAKQAGIHTAVETSGFAEWSVFEKVAPLTDLFLYDYKETDSQLHFAFTNQPNGPILANLRKLHDRGARILLRCPMIPEYNARREHLEGIARLRRELPRLIGVELLPYHRLGKAKLARFGFADTMPASVAPPTAETMQAWSKIAGL